MHHSLLFDSHTHKQTGKLRQVPVTIADSRRFWPRNAQIAEAQGQGISQVGSQRTLYLTPTFNYGIKHMFLPRLGHVYSVCVN